MPRTNDKKQNEKTKFIQTATDEELIEQLDELVAAAAAGDARAVGAIAIALGPMLLAEARAELGELFAHEDGVVLHWFHEALLGRELVFPRIRGAAVPWMKRMVRTMARARLAERGRGWRTAG
jgi:hypothetical protein